MKVSQALQVVTELSQHLAETESQLEGSKEQVEYLLKRGERDAERIREQEVAIQNVRSSTFNRVLMIKNFRVLTGLGLKEAKDIIDMLCGPESGRHSIDSFRGQLLKSIAASIEQAQQRDQHNAGEHRVESLGDLLKAKLNIDLPNNGEGGYQGGVIPAHALPPMSGCGDPSCCPEA